MDKKKRDREKKPAGLKWHQFSVTAEVGRKFNWLSIVFQQWLKESFSQLFMNYLIFCFSLYPKMPSFEKKNRPLNSLFPMSSQTQRVPLRRPDTVDVQYLREGVGEGEEIQLLPRYWISSLRNKPLCLLQQGKSKSSGEEVVKL